MHGADGDSGVGLAGHAMHGADRDSGGGADANACWRLDMTSPTPESLAPRMASAPPQRPCTTYIVGLRMRAHTHACTCTHTHTHFICYPHDLHAQILWATETSYNKLLIVQPGDEATTYKYA